MKNIENIKFTEINISDVKDRNEVKEFARQGLEKIKQAISNGENNMSKIFNQYSEDINYLKLRFAFSDFSFYNGSLSEIRQNYYISRHQEQMKESKKLLRNSRKIKGPNQEYL